MPLVLRLLGPVALSFSLSLASAGTAWPYHWPVKPFDKQHPIRGFFGDPRTVYMNSPLARLDRANAFSFHQGVDISAPDGTPVYPVASGVVHYLDAATLRIRADKGRTFQYFHLLPIVGEAQHVIAGRTVLGYVQAPFGHVHLTEIDGTHAVNPLQKGHLSPYSDHTRPTIRSVLFSNATGPLATPLRLCGRVEIAADAFDTPPVRVPGAFGGFPVAPALVRWRITRPGKARAVRWRTAADFRTSLPPNSRFFDVYAQGTYQNAPRFGERQFLSRSGRYLFLLAARYDTTHLQNGAHVLTVLASDERGNRTSFRERFLVSNNSGICPDSLSRKTTLKAQP